MTGIIADACCNHLGDIRILEQMIRMFAKIKNARVSNKVGSYDDVPDIIKFQAFKAENIKGGFDQDYYASVQLKDEHYNLIKDLCFDLELPFMFTIFTEDMIEKVKKCFEGTPYSYAKIASPDANNWSLIYNCVQAFDNIFISTGMHSPREIRDLRDYIKTLDHNKNIEIMYCISKYPTAYEGVDFDTMQLFDGFSDHTLTNSAAKTAMDLGVKYIERHYTLGKYLPGKDHCMSSSPDELKDLADYRNYLSSIDNYKKRWRTND